MKALFVCHDPPAPPNNGGSIDMLGMLQSLHRVGAQPDVFVTVKDRATQIDVQKISESCDRLYVAHRNLGWRAAASVLPYQIASREALRTFAFDRSYDVVISSDHCSGVFDNPRLKSKYAILRRNNDEVDYARRMAQASHDWRKRMFYRKESLLFGRWIRTADRRADQVWYISEAEWATDLAAGHKQTQPARLFLPAALDLQDQISPQPSDIASGRVLYFGSLTIPVNKAGVEWFVREVHPTLQTLLPEYKLTIAGRVEPAESSVISDWAAHANLQFIANPPLQQPVYAPGGVFVDPMGHDAGVKIKVLDALRRGYPVVCSPSSLRGSGLIPDVHVRVAGDSASFARQIVETIKQPERAVEMVIAAQSMLRQRFDTDRNIRSALAMLNGVTSGAGR